MFSVRRGAQQRFRVQSAAEDYDPIIVGSSFLHRGAGMENVIERSSLCSGCAGPCPLQDWALMAIGCKEVLFLLLHCRPGLRMSIFCPAVALLNVCGQKSLSSQVRCSLTRRVPDLLPGGLWLCVFSRFTLIHIASVGLRKNRISLSRDWSSPGWESRVGGGGGGLLKQQWVWFVEAVIDMGCFELCGVSTQEWAW